MCLINEEKHSMLNETIVSKKTWKSLFSENYLSGGNRAYIKKIQNKNTKLTFLFFKCSQCFDRLSKTSINESSFR